MSGDGFQTSRNRWSTCTWEREVDWLIFKVRSSSAQGPQVAKGVNAMRYWDTASMLWWLRGDRSPGRREKQSRPVADG